jgi:hypothetical protein
LASVGTGRLVNSGERAAGTVPPCWMMPPTSRAERRIASAIRPA